ncbi:MAG: DUF5119 domain-containing protein [Muribaculaceae bacterium]|nr:DUF5119 domain-containing protein [Muribaculaceae bacterium]
MKRHILLVITGLSLLTGCRHKDLDILYDDAGSVRVVFDWRNAPGAAPQSMEAFFFDSEAADEPVRFQFAGRDGGYVHIPAGVYSVIGQNSDNTDWAYRRNDHDPNLFEIYTGDASRLDALGLNARTLPRARGAEDERMAQAPGLLYGNRQDNISLQVSSLEQKVTLFPEEVTCHYTVEVRDVENIQNLADASLDATLSGMAEGYLQGQGCATRTPVTMPFTLSENRSDKTLAGHFLTFGECPEANHVHSLIVYMVFSDGTKRYQTFDVTDQVRNAPDPKNVHIIVSGLNIPRTIDSGGGFRPDVDPWESENIDLKM